MAKGKSNKNSDKKPKSRREKFTQSLRCELLPAEVAERSDRMAHRLAEIEQKTDELKAVSKHHKSIIETIEAEVASLAREVRDKSTYRQVDCERKWDYETGRYSETRLDTGDLISDRYLLESEKQPTFDFEDGDGHDPNKQPKPGATGPLPYQTAEDETWKTVPIAEAMPKLGKKVFEGLDKLGLHTMGELMQWKHGDGREHWWTDIPGVGKAACDKIDDAIVEFFAARNKK